MLRETSPADLLAVLLTVHRMTMSMADGMDPWSVLAEEADRL